MSLNFFSIRFFAKNTHTHSDVVKKREKGPKWDSVVLVVSESKCGVEEEDSGHGVTGRYFAKMRQKRHGTASLMILYSIITLHTPSS